MKAHSNKQGYNELFLAAYYNADVNGVIMSGVYTVPETECIPPVHWVAVKNRTGWVTRYDFENRTLDELKKVGMVVTDRRIVQAMTNCCPIMLTKYHT